MTGVPFTNRLVFYLLWIGVTALGWLAGAFDLTFHAQTYLEVVRLIPLYLLDGVLIGFVTGIGQALILRRFMP